VTRQKIGGGKISSGVRVECDVGDDSSSCDAFTSYSFVTVGRKQAAAIGWGRPRLDQIRDWKDLELGSDGRRLLDACPLHHKRITADLPALIAERARDKAARSAQAKAEQRAIRDRERADKREMAKLKREMTKLARDAARLEKRQAKATRAALRDPRALRSPLQLRSMPPD